MAKERIERGCRCRCGQITYSTYAPGHDSKHISKLVALVVEKWGTTPWDCGQVWQGALSVLETPALQAKFRMAMKRKAEKWLGYNIDKMNDERWQQVIHLQALLARDDEQFARSPLGHTRHFSTRNLAVYAAALGWTRSIVNMKRS